MKKPVIIDRFQGIAVSPKEGQPDEVSYVRSVNVHEDKTKAFALPKTMKDSSSVATGMVIDGVQVGEDYYFIDEDKKFYKRTAAGSWQALYSITGDTKGMGMEYVKSKDTIYITTDTSVSTYGPIGGTPVFTENRYDTYVDQTVNVTGTEYPKKDSIAGHWSLDEQPDAPQSANRVGHWTLDELSGSATDISGNGNELTANNNPTGTTNNKEGRMARTFSSGSDEDLTISDADQTGLDVTGDMTIATWLYLESGSANQTIVAMWPDTSGDRAYTFQVQSDDTLLFGMSSDGSATTTSETTDTLNTNTWYHVAVVYDAGSSVKFYIDGSLVETDTTSIAASLNASSGGFGMACRGPGTASSNNLNGRLDNVTIWDTTLTDAEIVEHMGVTGDRSDSSGNNITLRSVNGPLGSTSDPQEGDGNIVLDRSSYSDPQYLTTDNDTPPSALQITGPLTISAWIKLDSVGVEQNIVVLYRTTSDRRGYRLYINASNQLALAVTPDGTSSGLVAATGSTTLSTGTWYHVAGVYDPSTSIKVYVDAVEDGSNTTSIPASIYGSARGFAIGTYYVDTESPSPSAVDGQIDDVVIWDTKLDSSDITDVKAVPGPYFPKTSVTEGDDDEFPFEATSDPISFIDLTIGDPGAGDWTVTIHDDADTERASATVTNANLSAGNNTFTFSSPFRPVIGQTYHAHITSTVADGRMTSGQTLELNADRLISADWHPIEEFFDSMYIANERYITEYALLEDQATDTDGTLPTSWDIRKVVLPSGYEITCMTKFDEFLVAGAKNEQKDTGLLIFWDGTSDNYNFFTEISDGPVWAVFNHNNHLRFTAGKRGELFEHNGSDYVKLKRFPNTSYGNTIYNMFSSMTSYQGLLLVGMAYTSDSTTFENGVYGYGSKERLYPDTFTLEHVQSGGNFTGTTKSIGMVKSFGNKLFIAWRDGSSYGVDLVQESNDPYETAVIAPLIYDDGAPHKRKKLLGIKITHSPLVSGDSVQVYYRIDRNGGFTVDTANTTVGTTETIAYPTKNERLFHDLEVKVLFGGSVEIYAIVYEVEDNRENDKVLENA